MPAICSMKCLCPVYSRLTKTSTYMMPSFLRSFPDVESLRITPAECDQAQLHVLRRSGCSQGTCAVAHLGDAALRVPAMNSCTTENIWKQQLTIPKL